MDSSIVKIIDVNVNEIIPNRFQPRRQFDEDEIRQIYDNEGAISRLEQRVSALENKSTS